MRKRTTRLRRVSKKARPARAARQARRAGRKARRADEKLTKRVDKKLAKRISEGEHGRITPGRAKKVIGVAKVVVPVLVPFARHAATAARERYDRMRARHLGVPVDQLGSFSGRGAALHARIAGDAEALRDLRTQSAGNDEVSLAAEQYAERTAARLAQLTSAVRAAERMPAQRRRSAHRAVDAELGEIEDELLTRFGIRARTR
ncbi:hypothetical protein GCM10011581_19640 [Saccharopolyspora subtropica]|uniref:Uncharacterized protein n=1 Tax=Saccharopolyspora thermophila TaxID=89367 RepID=A0A917NA73_9PSEU|nr:DUF6474 family protein [Saccharopolyspora subtropica]GGI82298.1 hypothetical protein GCM10011581_19640 [Saccharopolyspora subtropica]